MRLLPYGERALLVELDSLTDVHRLHEAVRAAAIAVDSVPGWRTLLVTTDGAVGALAEALQALAQPVGEDRATIAVPSVHDIPVEYDGADLADVATACGLGVEEVVALHCGATYTVGFLGFARGFPYLAGLPTRLRLPRRATPRSVVPTGSVAIARDQCGIYPAASPGGWHLLGRTHVSLFDPAADPPTRLAPGDQVRFVRMPVSR